MEKKIIHTALNSEVIVQKTKFAIYEKFKRQNVFSFSRNINSYRTEIGLKTPR